MHACYGGRREWVDAHDARHGLDRSTHLGRSGRGAPAGGQQRGERQQVVHEVVGERGVDDGDHDVGLVQRGDYLTLVTSGFIHADLAHLLLNCFTLWSFGFGLERRIGTTSFLVLYAAGLLVSSVATWLLHRRQPAYASLGASGAILAVLFASVVVAPTASLYLLPVPVPIPAPLFAIGYLAYSVLAGRARVGRINHDAHVAGALTGLAYMAITMPGSLQRAFGAWLG